VFHLAAEMRGATAALFLTNVVGTRNLIKAALGAGVGRFVLVSSLAVYAPLPRGSRLDEDCPIEDRPHLRDPYAYSKVAQERVAWEAHREAGLPLVVVRPGVIYGPGRDCLSSRVGLKVGRLMVAMGGRQLMPYTHVENCAAAVALAGTRPGVEGRAFNVIDDDPPTGKQLLRQYRKAVGGVRSVRVPGWLVPVVSGWCEWYHRKSRGQLPDVLTRYKSRAMWTPVEYSNARAKEALGWQPEKRFAEGLEETFRWLRQDREKARAVPAGGGL
jgi:nucleoside-diphosphate-sugar epimerase